VGMAIGALALSMLPMRFGIAGYIGCIILLTPHYALFQAANNTVIMKDVHPDQRGVISGLLSLSRNLGLITGASLMGAVFTAASRTDDVSTAHPAAVAAGMHATFAVAAALILSALAMAMGRRAFALHSSPSREAS
jgi:predicted MFS family arabinose efflux permease